MDSALGTTRAISRNHRAEHRARPDSTRVAHDAEPAPRRSSRFGMVHGVNTHDG